MFCCQIYVLISIDINKPRFISLKYFFTHSLLNLTHRSNDRDNEQHDEPGGEDNARPVVSGQKIIELPGGFVCSLEEVCFGCQRREASEGLLTVREGCESLCLLAMQKKIGTSFAL